MAACFISDAFSILHLCARSHPAACLFEWRMEDVECFSSGLCHESFLHWRIPADYSMDSKMVSFFLFLFCVFSLIIFYQAFECCRQCSVHKHFNRQHRFVFVFSSKAICSRRNNRYESSQRCFLPRRCIRTSCDAEQLGKGFRFAVPLMCSFCLPRQFHQYFLRHEL